MTTQNSTNSYATSKYIVDSSGSAPYATIQSAITAAAAAGSGVVYIKPGTYAENLLLSSNINLVGTSGTGKDGEVEIVGVHLPPATGKIAFKDLILGSATNVLSSVGIGTAVLLFNNCEFKITNGFIVAANNWTGNIDFQDCRDNSAANGIVRNTSSATVTIRNCQLGIGGNTMQVNDISIFNSDIGTDILIAGSAVNTFFGSRFTNQINQSSSGDLNLLSCYCATGAIACITGTGNTIISQTILESAAANVVIGTGSVEIVSIDMLDSTSFLAGVGVGASTQTKIGILNVADGNIITTANGDITSSLSLSGSTLSHTVRNNENTNTASNASVVLGTGGAAGGDPYSLYHIDSIRSFAAGIDNTDGDTFKLTTAAAASVTPSSATSLFEITPAGSRTMPLNPCVLQFATSQPNVTGDGTAYTVGFAAGVFDQQNVFLTQTLTAPTTGRYYISASVQLGGVLSTHTNGTLQIVTSNRTYNGETKNYGAIATATPSLVVSVNAICDMDITDTATIRLTVSNGTKVIDITTFSYITINLIS